MGVYKDDKTASWFCKFYFKDWQGDRHQTTKRGFKTKRDALRWQADFIAKENRSMHISFEAYVKIYFEDKKNKLKERTVYNKKYMIDKHILPYFKNKKVDEVTSSDIIQWQNAMEEKGYAIDTVRHHLAILKKICRLAYKKGYAEKCHFQHFALPKQSERTPRALSRESFEKIRDVEIPAYRKSHMLARDLFLFACYTGVSYADAVSITNENLYTDDNGALWLKYRRKKNEHRASVKLLPEALALLEKYKDETRETLFPIIHHPNMKRHMKALAALAGIKDDLCYHQARHSFASLITLEAGVPIETISRMLGHSDISTTQVYARVSPKKLFEDMDKFIEATKDFQLVL